MPAQILESRIHAKFFGFFDIFSPFIIFFTIFLQSKYHIFAMNSIF